MSRRANGTPIGFVDPACPINWDHPLVKGTGLVAQWAVIPNSGWRGGNILRDLTRGGKNPHDGTFGASTAAPTWSGNRGRRGGFGSLSFDGSNDYVQLGVASGAISISGPVTVSLWLRYNALGSRRIAAAFVKDDGSSASNSFDFELTYNDPNKLGVVEWGGNTIVSATPPAAGNWVHVTYTTYNGADVLYFNGASVATNSRMNFQTGTVGVARLGAFNAAYPDPYWLGQIDDVQIRTVVMSAAQVAALYQESSRGYPEMWNWMGARTWFVPPAAAPAANQGVIVGSPIVGSRMVVGSSVVRGVGR